MSKLFPVIVGLVLVSVFSQPAMAGGSKADAEKVFTESADVETATKSLNKAGFTKDDGIDVVELGGGCGFAGCSAEYLVVQRWSTRGANTRTSPVLAKVSFPPVGDKPTIGLIELKIK